ncbi:hypothetical protein [Rhizobium sp. Z1P35]
MNLVFSVYSGAVMVTAALIGACHPSEKHPKTSSDLLGRALTQIGLIGLTALRLHRISPFRCRPLLRNHPRMIMQQLPLERFLQGY